MNADSIPQILFVVTAQIMPGIHQPLFEKAGTLLHKRGPIPMPGVLGGEPAWGDYPEVALGQTVLTKL